MTKKETFWTKQIKRFYNISTLDEYQEQELNKIGNRALMVIWQMTIIANIVFILILNKNPQVAAWTMLTYNILVFAFAIPLYILSKTKRLKLSLQELEKNDFEKQVKKARHKAFIAAINWTFWMAFFMTFITWWKKGGSYLNLLLRPAHLIIYLIAGCVFGILLWLFYRSNIRKEEE